MPGGVRQLWLGLLMALSALPAIACPVCDSGTGQAVRQGIFDGSFGQNLLVTLLPFPVLAGIVLAIYFGVPSPRRLFRRRTNAQSGTRPDDV